MPPFLRKSPVSSRWFLTLLLVRSLMSANTCSLQHTGSSQRASLAPSTSANAVSNSNFCVRRCSILQSPATKDIPADIIFHCTCERKPWTCAYTRCTFARTIVTHYCTCMSSVGLRNLKTARPTAQSILKTSALRSPAFLVGQIRVRQNATIRHACRSLTDSVSALLFGTRLLPINLRSPSVSCQQFRTELKTKFFTTTSGLYKVTNTCWEFLLKIALFYFMTYCCLLSLNTVSALR